MSLPAVLGYGSVSLYSIYQHGISGMFAPTGFNFGLIDQVSVYGIQYGAAVGQSVMFNGNDIVCTLTSGDWKYSVIKEDAIILTELAL